jgi:hypothetical protein
VFLNEKDRRRIVGFLTFTPMEKKMAFEDDLDAFTMLSKRSSKGTKKTTNGRKNGRLGRKRHSAHERAKSM